MGATAYGFLFLAAVLEVGGDYLMRTGLPWARGRMVSGALLLALYGFAVNLLWRGEFSRLLGLYVAVFLVVSQVWGRVAEGESISEDGRRRSGRPGWFGDPVLAGGRLSESAARSSRRDDATATSPRRAGTQDALAPEQSSRQPPKKSAPSGPGGWRSRAHNPRRCRQP